MEKETYSTFEFALLIHHASIRTTICGLTKYLMHQHFVPHNTTSNHQMKKDIDKGLMPIDIYTGLITHKIVERTTEDSIMPPARGQNIKILLS